MVESPHRRDRHTVMPDPVEVLHPGRVGDLEYLAASLRPRPQPIPAVVAPRLAADLSAPHSAPRKVYPIGPMFVLACGGFARFFHRRTVNPVIQGVGRTVTGQKRPWRD